MTDKRTTEDIPEITPRMLDAGLRELDGARGAYDDMFLLRAVYTAMREAERRDTRGGNSGQSRS